MSLAVFVVAGVVFFAFVQSFLAKDHCLDAGGRWLATSGSCDFSGSGPHDWLDRMWAIALTAGGLASVVGLALGSAMFGFMGGFRGAA